MRNFIEAASSDPLKFRKDSNTSSVVFKDRNETLLHLDFGKEIESGKFLNRNNVESNPILQVTSISTKFGKLALNSTEHKQKEVALEATGKTRCHLTVEIASQLDSLSGNLK